MKSSALINFFHSHIHASESNILQALENGPIPIGYYISKDMGGYSPKDEEVEEIEEMLRHDDVHDDDRADDHDDADEYTVLDEGGCTTFPFWTIKQNDTFHTFQNIIFLIQHFFEFTLKSFILDILEDKNCLRDLKPHSSLLVGYTDKAWIVKQR